jgi:hypothetical protein
LACLWRGVETNHTKRKTHTQHKTHKQSANFVRCALSLFPNAPSFILATLFSPNRGQPFAVFLSALLRLRWVLCLLFRFALSLTLGKISHPTHNTRSRCSYIQNRFALCFVLVAFFVSLYLAECATFCGFPFVAVSVRFPQLSAPSLPFSRVPFGCPLWVLVVFVLCSRVAVVSCVWFGLRPQTFRSVFQFLPRLRSLSGVFLLFHASAVVFFPKTAAKVRRYLGGLQ